METRKQLDVRENAIRNIELAARLATCGDPDKDALKEIEKTEPRKLAEAKPPVVEHFEPEDVVLADEDATEVDDDERDPSGSFNV